MARGGRLGLAAYKPDCFCKFRRKTPYLNAIPNFWNKRLYALACSPIPLHKRPPPLALLATREATPDDQWT